MDIKLNKILQDSMVGTHMENLGVGNKTVLEWALKIDPESVVLFSGQELTKAMYSLTQYAAFLQAQLNIREATFLYEKRKFGREIALAISKYKGTVQEREAKALDEVDELKMLEDRMIAAESQFIIFKKMPESILEKVNVIKKEMSRRGVDKV